MNNEDAQLQAEAIEVLNTIEDSVEYLCREFQLSGEKVWTMISALSDVKLKQFPPEDEEQFQED
jgi:hypothetical protein|tara:strand:- start:1238 stop:1429 length:192 start_codon:yes stop_codon:yes gene_type:complete